MHYFYFTIAFALVADLLYGWLRRFSDRCQRDLRLIEEVGR
jgi:hypothetical protein